MQNLQSGTVLDFMGRVGKLLSLVRLHRTVPSAWVDVADTPSAGWLRPGVAGHLDSRKSLDGNFEEAVFSSPAWTPFLPSTKIHFAIFRQFYSQDSLPLFFLQNVSEFVFVI